MSVTIEFLGMARRQAGVASVTVDARSLGEALLALARMLPNLEGACIQNGTPREGYLACLNGGTFTNDPNTTLSDGDRVMILSADVGG